MSEPHVEKQKPVPPFVQFCCASVPMVFDDSLSYYEALCAMWKYLDETVKVINNNALVTEELIAKVDELKEYVDHYFDNLDVQEEINNKLDEMADSGQLADIISQYLELSCVLAYDTKTAMKSADNMINGSICQTLGDTAINDVKGSLYKIRTITSGDVVDDDNIVALTNFPTLIAQKIITSRNKLLIFGDSWSMNNYPYVSDQDDMWYRRYAKLHNLEVTSYAQSGAGYTVNDNTFDSQVDTAIANENSNDIKQIIVFGGLNDISGYVYGSGTLYTACNNLLNKIKTNFPNADITVIALNTPDGLIELRSCHAKNELENATLINSVRFIDSITFMLGFSTMFGENTNHHPNATGQRFLSGVINSSINGSYHRQVITENSPYAITKAADWLPDLVTKITYYDTKTRVDVSITVGSAFGSTYEATYTFTQFDLNHATIGSLMRSDTDPTQTPCILKKGTSANQVKIVIPSGVTGTWVGSFEVDY